MHCRVQVAGLEFLLKPEWDKVNANVFLSAMGQAFFSLSLGMGCLCTYASYFKKDTNLTKTAFSVSIIDTFVAILAGLIIFPAAFSVGIQPDAGPSLIFITLPNVFQQAFSGVPLLAYIFSVMFYILLAVAALTSTISMHEVVTAYLHEEFHLSRKRQQALLAGGCIFLGILCSLSLGVGNGLYYIWLEFIRPVRLCHSQDHVAIGWFVYFHLHRLVPEQEDCLERNKQ